MLCYSTYCYKSYYTREEISNALYLNGCIVRRNILHKHSINFREGGTGSYAVLTSFNGMSDAIFSLNSATTSIMTISSRC